MQSSVYETVRPSVRPIIRPPHAAVAAGLLLSALPAKDIDRSTAAAAGRPAAVRRSAANASNVTSTADVRS